MSNLNTKFGGFEALIQGYAKELNRWIEDAHNHGLTIEASTYDESVPYPVVSVTLSGTYVEEPHNA